MTKRNDGASIVGLSLTMGAAIACGYLYFSGSAQAEVFHYACKGQGSHYAVIVNDTSHVLKMKDHGPSGKVTTFRLLSNDPIDDKPDACGRGGYSLSDGATFCFATQGDGYLDWQGHHYDCDQAD